jgi:hypothetical protein
MLNQLPLNVVEFITRANAFDIRRLTAAFADDALVNDNHRQFWGKQAIKVWGAREMVGDRATVEVTEVVQHWGMPVVCGRDDGDDKTGLPDGLMGNEPLRGRGPRDRTSDCHLPLFDAPPMYGVPLRASSADRTARFDRGGLPVSRHVAALPIPHHQRVPGELDSGKEPRRDTIATDHPDSSGSSDESEIERDSQ